MFSVSPRLLSGLSLARSQQPMSWRRDWKYLLIAALAVYAVSLSVRLFDVPAWSDPAYRVAGERVMSTPDAYYWLAGAKGAGRAVGLAPSQLAALAARTFGVGLDAVGFWAPAIVASFVAPVMLLWAWTLGGLEAGLLAGLLASLAPAYYFRTRLGGYDTDFATLLIPLCVSLVLARGIGPWLEGEMRSDKLRPETNPLPWYLAVAVIGLFAHFTPSWHTMLGVYNILIAIVALALALVWGAPEFKARAALSATLFLLCVLPGGGGLAVAALVIAATTILPFQKMQKVFAGLFSNWTIFFALAAVLAFVSTADVFSEFRNTSDLFLKRIVSKIISDPTATLSAHSGLPMEYPEMAQSIEEAQHVSVAGMLSMLHPWSGVALAGLFGFILVVVYRPETLLLAPMLLLGLASIGFGVRTVMFAAPAMALGFALPLVWFLNGRWCDGAWRRPAVTAIVIAVSALLVAPLVTRYAKLSYTPVVLAAHGKALAALGHIAPPKSRIWAWWDYGYAGQYYANLAPFADGGHQGAEYVYIVSKVLTTDNPAQANQLIHFTGMHHYSPWNIWNQYTASEHASFLEQLKHQGHLYTEQHKQYLVISAEALQIAPSILEFGSWDARARASAPPYSELLLFMPEIDFEKGAMQAADKKTLALDGIYKALNGRVETFSFEKRKGLHLVLLPDAGVRLLLDANGYNSLLVQLLICPPGDSRYTLWFKLVYDDAPFARIYEVL